MNEVLLYLQILLGLPNLFCICVQWSVQKCCLLLNLWYSLNNIVYLEEIEKQPECNCCFEEDLLYVTIESFFICWIPFLSSYYIIMYKYWFIVFKVQSNPNLDYEESLLFFLLNSFCPPLEAVFPEYLFCALY